LWTEFGQRWWQKSGSGSVENRAMAAAAKFGQSDEIRAAAAATKFWQWRRRNSGKVTKIGQRLDRNSGSGGGGNSGSGCGKIGQRWWQRNDENENSLLSQEAVVVVVLGSGSGEIR